VQLEQHLTPDAPEPESADPQVNTAWKLKTRSGRALYGKRKSTVDPIKQVLGFRQFSLRGLGAVTGEWKPVTMPFNLKRMHVLAAGEWESLLIDLGRAKLKPGHSM
jgi:hypothetical protein